MFLPRFLIKSISTFFYLGYLPLIPGTFGSIAGLLVFFLVAKNLFLYIIFSLGILILGFSTSGKAERLFKRRDCRYIVIDEVTGMLLALIFMPFDLVIIVIAFLLFRLLDTLKPYPASLFQEKRGSIGIMGDDIIAGLYTNIILQAVLRLTSFRIS